MKQTIVQVMIFFEMRSFAFIAFPPLGAGREPISTDHDRSFATHPFEKLR
jgi:hypothetical protein